MSGELQIDPEETPGGDRDTARPTTPVVNSPHPWWSRVLYAVYALAALVAGGFAWREGSTELAIGAAVMALVLGWKASQRVR